MSFPSSNQQRQSSAYKTELLYIFIAHQHRIPTRDINSAKLYDSNFIVCMFVW